MRGPSSRQKDVLGEQVAVTVDDATSGDALGEQRFSSGEKPPGELRRPARASSGRSGRGVNADSSRTFPAHNSRSASGVATDEISAVLGERASTVGDRPGDGPQAPGDVVTLTHQDRQLAVGRETPHQHRVVHHPTGVVEDVLDAQVDVRAEPSGSAPPHGHTPRRAVRACSSR